MYRVLVPTLFLAACAANNAELTEGSYVAFISDRTSLSLTKGTIDPSDYEGMYEVDCRSFEDGTFASQDDEDSLRLEDWVKICGPEVWPPQYEQWATQAGFFVVEEELEPWRGEALITSEGDLQISFHHRVPGGQDMRFVISVDPDFSPTTCVQDEDGNTERVPMDGDWVGEWSKELQWIAEQDDEVREPYSHLEPYLDDGRLYFLNAFSYQFNPFDTSGSDWDLPEYWIAGAAQSKFVDEVMNHRSARYGEPEIYNNIEANDSTTEASGVSPADLWYCEMEPGDDTSAAPCRNDNYADLEEQDAHVREVAAGIHTELERLFTPDADADPIFSYAPITHTNFWRAPDGRPAGFDGWSELHYNYVVFSGDSDLTEGGRAEGAFSLTFDADISSSRMFVKGSFVIDKIKKDRWKTADLQADKLVENGVELCSAASEADANPAGDE